MNRHLLTRTALLLIGSMWLPLWGTAQTPGTSAIEEPTAGTSAVRALAVETPPGRFFTTTGVSLAFPVGALRHVAQFGRGTAFNIEYRINARFSLAGAWDANSLSVQTTKLVAMLDPALKVAVNELKGKYQVNAFGLYAVWYGKNRRVSPYLIGGIGLNSITVPELRYQPQTRLLSLESASTQTIFLSGGFGINWQFSKPVAAFGEASAYIVPASSPVAARSNNYLTAKMGLRFPLF